MSRPKLFALLCVLAFVKFGRLSELNNQTEFYSSEKSAQNQTESNGLSQTNEQIDAKDLFKSFLLEKLNLNSIPTNLTTDTKVPKFMLDIFATNSYKQSRIFLPHDSNTIRSHPIIASNRKLISKRNKSGFLIKFNLTVSLTRETLNAGEFRLYLNRSNRCSSRKQRITINQIIQTSGQTNAENHYTTITEENILLYRQIDTLVIKFDRFMDKPMWIQFDVLPAVECWLKNSSLNNGLLIKSFCVDRNEHSLNEAKFVDNFVITPSFGDDYLDEMYDHFKPLLLTYSNFQSTADYSADNFDLFMSKKKRHINSQAVSSFREDNGNNDWKKSGNDCGKYPMYVDFKEIGWEDWVVSPTGFNAYLCHGQCSLAFVRNSNTSNHATTQLLYSLSNGIPPPCCVPTEFAPMAMIYREGPRSSVLKVYDNMIVTRCGCK